MLRGFCDRWTDICDCRVALATEKSLNDALKAGQRPYRVVVFTVKLIYVFQRNCNFLLKYLLEFCLTILQFSLSI